VKTVDDSNPSLDLGLRSEQEDESSSIIQQMRQVKTDVNLILERLIGQGAARPEASRREWNEERDLWTERCCRLESEKQALQAVVERHKEEKKQLAIDYERKLRDKDNEISKLMTRNKLSLPTIQGIPAYSAAMQNPRTIWKIDDKEKKTPRREDNGGVPTAAFPPSRFTMDFADCLLLFLIISVLLGLLFSFFLFLHFFSCRFRAVDYADLCRLSSAR